MPVHDEILTVAQIAAELKGSEARIHNAINGKDAH
jgi:hypothetical protein